MKLKMYAVRDGAAQVFMRPFPSQSDGVAIRDFTTAVNEPNRESQLYMHPEDFDLYVVGEWDNETGMFAPAEVPSQIARGKQVAVRS